MGPHIHEIYQNVQRGLQLVKHGSDPKSSTLATLTTAPVIIVSVGNLLLQKHGDRSRTMKTVGLVGYEAAFSQPDEKPRLIQDEGTESLLGHRFSGPLVFKEKRFPTYAYFLLIIRFQRCESNEYLRCENQRDSLTRQTKVYWEVLNR